MCMGCCRMRSTLDTLFRQRFDHIIGRGVNVVAKIIPDLHRREKTKAFSFEKAGKQTGVIYVDRNGYHADHRRQSVLYDGTFIGDRRDICLYQRSLRKGSCLFELLVFMPFISDDRFS